MSSHEQLGMVIREARLEKSLSLGQLASAVGRSSSSVRRWERGEVAPAASVLPKLAAILEVDIEDLRDDGSVPTAGSDKADPQDKIQNGRISTVEQPVVDSKEPPTSTSQVASDGSSSSQPVLAGFWDSVTKGGQGWMGWIRGALTVAVLVVMLFVLVWALGELFGALGQVLDSFDVGSSGG
jgi:transcriptional regulator with XRE-family HTH domain